MTRGCQRLYAGFMLPKLPLLQRRLLHVEIIIYRPAEMHGLSAM